MEDQEGVVAAVDVFDHEGGELVLLRAGAAVEEDVLARLDQGQELVQHGLVLRQMLDHAHDHDGVVFAVRLVLQQVGKDQLPVEAEALALVGQIVDGNLGDGDARAFHAPARGIFHPGAPAGTDLQDMVAGLQLQFLEAIVELAQGRDVEGLVRRFIDALGVAGSLGIEKAQEEIRIDVVMRGDRLPVGVNLAEDQGLDEAPGVGQQMEILHRPAELERAQHVALEVDVAGEIGIAEAAFVEAGDGLERPGVLQRDMEARGIGTEMLQGAVGQHHVEGYGGIGKMRREAAEQAASGGRGPRAAACRGLRQFQIVYHGASRASLACGAEASRVGHSRLAFSPAPAD